MQNLVLRGGITAVFATLFVTTASSVQLVEAHVHAVTPLNDCTVDNAEHSGGRIIVDTPAGAENGGPIQPGPIPLNTGNAPFGDGGGGDHADPRCP